MLRRRGRAGRRRPILLALALALAAAAPAPALAQFGGKPAGEPAAGVGRDYIVGAWTDSDDCAAAVAFAGDGTFVTPEGGEGRWQLDGTELILAGLGGVRTLRIIPVDDDTMDVVNEDGSRGRSVRCAPEERDDGPFVARGIA